MTRPAAQMDHASNPAARRKAREGEHAMQSGRDLDRIVVLSWFDVFPFDDPATITCPDCDGKSPELRDPWETVRWVDRHVRECGALGPDASADREEAES